MLVARPRDNSVSYLYATRKSTPAPEATAVIAIIRSLLFLQEDLSEDEGGSSPKRDAPVTSQPSPNKPGNTTVFAMPAPPTVGENAALNQGDHPVYTPG